LDNGLALRVLGAESY
jgi:hypothetical protein